MEVSPVGEARMAAHIPRLTLEQRTAVAEQEASLVFADVSGYTRLTERFASAGRGGAELLTAIVNRCFTILINEVHAVDGDVVRFGGDALFVVVTGSGRLARAAALAARMQMAIRDLPVVLAPGGPVRLRMSIGLHDGTLFTYRWHGAWTDVVPIGPAVSETLRLESVAAPGEVRVSAVVADQLGPAYVRNGTLRLSAASRLPLPPCVQEPQSLVAVKQFVAPALREVLLGDLPAEHRAVSAAFVLVEGTDDLCTAGDLRTELDPIFSALADAVALFGVVPIGTDVAADGTKSILVTGVPTATEDDEDRLLAAVRFVVAAAPRCRAGVHTGVVFCGDVGHPLRRTFTVMGDAVNVAARLAAKAGAGQVLASKALLDVVGASYVTTPLQPVELKGKSGFHFAATVGERVPLGPALSEWPFRGRRVELSRLLEHLREPGAVEIVGEAGMGATRLLDEAIGSLAWSVTVVRATVEDRRSTLSVARRALIALGGEAPTVPDSGGAAAVIDSMVLALAKCWERGSCVEGAVLVVDRTHHADEASVASLRSLAAIAADTGCRLVTIGRVGVLNAEEPIAMGPLDAQDVRALCVDASIRPLSDAELDAIVSRSAGNPRFAEQLARLPQFDAEVPVSMEALITARLDRLPRASRQVVREAALIGSVVSVDVAAAVTGRDVGTVLEAMAAARGVVAQIDDKAFQFDDEALREVAYRGLSVELRHRLHAAMAELLGRDPEVSTSQIAHHVFEAGDDAATWRWSGQAAREAHSSGACASAAAEATRALNAGRRLQRPISELLEMANLLAEAAIRAGLSAVADDALAQAFALDNRPDARAELLIQRARVAQREGRWRSARARLAAAQRIARGAAAVSVTIELGFFELDRGRLDEALQMAERAAEAARLHRRPDLEARALLQAEEIGELTGRADNELLGRKALALARSSQNAELIAKAANNLAVSASNRGRFEEALALYHEAEQLFATVGDVGFRALAGVNRFTILTDMGDTDAVVAELPELLRITAAAGLTSAVGVCEMLLATSAGRRGQPRDAVQRAERAIERIKRGGQSEQAVGPSVGLIELLILDGRHSEALALADRNLETAESLGPGHARPLALQRLRAMALTGLGDVATARSLLVDVCRRADETGILHERCFARWAIAQLPDGGLQIEEQRVLTKLETELTPTSAVLYRTAWMASELRNGA